MKKEELRFRVIFISVLVFVFLVVAIGITGKVINDSAEIGNETGEVKVCAQNAIEVCEGGYVSGYDENDCPVYKCPSCNEGDVREYTCPDGKEVDWCHCSGGAWVCVNSPENSCQSQTCSVALCEDASPYFTGNYDEYNCPIYKCPGRSCNPDEIIVYNCPDGSSVTSCKCDDGRWACIANADWLCPTQACPEGCICNENTVTCSYSENGTLATEASAGGGRVSTCPAGCLCTEDQIVCEQNLTSKGKCAIGCELNETCVLPGIRTSDKYCDIDSEWKLQKVNEEFCNNNFECETNVCIDGKCITHNFIERILEWLRNLFG